MRANLLLELLSDDHAWTDGDGATHEVDDARATVLAACKLEHADGDVERRACAPGSPVALLSRPGVWLQVVKDRVESELTLTNRYQEATESLGVALVKHISGLAQAQLALDLRCRERLVALKDVGFGAVLESKLMHEGHASVRDQTNQRVLWDEVD